MIEANKGGPMMALIDAYIGRKVRGAFRSVSVRGELPSSEGGLLVYLNHSSFWDGFVVHQLGKQAGWDVYAMMEEANLARYRFHARIGAFGVDKADPRGALASIRYARRLLERPRAAVCIFPEGKLLPGGQPLGPLQRGLEVLARSAAVRSVGVAVRYAFLEHEYPDVLLDVGEPHPPLALEGYRRELERLVERGRAAVSLEGYRVLVQGRSGVQERWDAVRQVDGARASASPAPARGRPA